jgi:DNA-binding SARP family transcriptional activator/TolB-like protein
VPVRICLVGPLEIVVDDAVVRLPARKTEALLAVLALRPGVAFGREWLAALLWPDVPEAQGRTSLRQAVGHLRKALGNSLVVSSAERIHLDPAGARFDTVELERLCARPPSEREPILEICRGSLLDGFAATEQPFDDWLSDQRARLGEWLSARLEECLASASATGELERALRVGGRLLELEPTREATHRALMKLHAEQGDRAAALRQYERCRELLQRHLGLAPAAETQDLRRALLAQGPAAEPASGRCGPDRDPGGRMPLAVLPFAATTGDEAARLLAGGLTEDVTTELSRFRQLALIARASVAEVALRSCRPETVGRETGARLVLSGSVRSAGSRARVTASLTDATTGLELWSERWDTAHDDPFGVVDALTKSVVAALALRIDEARLGSARDRPRERLEVYDCWLRGLECLRRGTPSSDDEARSFFQQALTQSPRFARAYSGLSLAHFNDWSCQAWTRWEERERLSFENAKRAVELDDGDHVTQTILARIYVYRREFELGERHLGRALSLNSNDADMLMHAALALTQLGDASRASELCADALRLNPKQPDWYFAVASFACLLARNPEDAIRLGQRAPDSMVDTRALLAVACVGSGRDLDAREHARCFIGNFRQKIVPEREPERGEPVRWLLHVSPFRRTADRDYLLEGLLRAGLDAP